MSRRLFAPFAVGLLSVMSIAGVACSSDAKEDTKEAADSVGDDIKDGAEDAGDAIGTKSDEAAARAAAEELRTRMKSNDTANDEGIRSIAALEESAEDLTGSPEVTGIEDSDGDGLDDDGKVQINVGDSSACLTLPEEGEDTQVEGGAC